LELELVDGLLVLVVEDRGDYWYWGKDVWCYGHEDGLDVLDGYGLVLIGFEDDWVLTGEDWVDYASCG
jgi:hypothetical protein